MAEPNVLSAFCGRSGGGGVGVMGLRAPACRRVDRLLLSTSVAVLCRVGPTAAAAACAVVWGWAGGCAGLWPQAAPCTPRVEVGIGWMGGCRGGVGRGGGGGWVWGLALDPMLLRPLLSQMSGYVYVHQNYRNDIGSCVGSPWGWELLPAQSPPADQSLLATDHRNPFLGSKSCIY